MNRMTGIGAEICVEVIGNVFENNL